MPPTQTVTTNNRLLAALPGQDRAKLLVHCECVELMLAERLNTAGDLIPHVYFPTESFVSLVMPVDARDSLEVGLVGAEGMLGISLIMGVHTAPFHAIVQGQGQALRLPAAVFLQKVEQCPALREVLNRYLYVTLRQLAQTAACTHFHVLEARLARWLLMAQDRAHADHFHVTHVFLACMLGVRRVGITKAAHALQEQKLIRYQRGNITILDRGGLKAVSCGCYRADKDTYGLVFD